MRKSILLMTMVAACLGVTAHAQMAHRLKGSLRGTGGAPIVDASVNATNLSGFRGEPFAGAKEHVAKTTDKGEWNIAGIEAGVWLFSSDAPGTVPAAIVIPVKFAVRQQVSAIGNSLTWQLPMWAYPAGEHPMLKIALEHLAAGRKEDASQALTVALGADIPTETRVAAGELSLLAQHASLAKTIFAMVIEKEPKHGRALLGAAGAALMGRDWETAGKLLWTARDLAPKEQRQALAAAIDDLRGIARVQ